MNLPRQGRDVGERGAVLIIVIILFTTLLTGAAIALSLQVSDTRAAGMVRRSHEALYCAESGLASARAVVGSNFALWATLIDADPTNDPAWYPIEGDLDQDGVNDFIVRVRDNDDELPPAINDPFKDNDLTVFMVARCTKYADTPREILELVGYEGAGNVYRDQAGQGSGGTGNSN